MAATRRSLSDLFVVERSYLADTIYGKIMRCRCKTSGDVVAIKVYERTRAQRHRTRAGYTVLEDAETELDLLKRLRARPHPHLVAEHASGEHLLPGARVEYAVMPYADGGDLLTYLRTTDISTAVAKRHFVRILCAVRHLHRMGYAHRDVSLENVLLVSEPDGSDSCVDMGMRPVLGDYGLAVELGRQPAPSATRPGKPGYMSPEIFNYQSYDAAKADVYSLGVVLFGLLARALPYNTPASSDVAFRMIQDGRLDDLLRAWSLTSRFAGGVVPLLSAMFHRDPSRRPSLDQILAHPSLAEAVTQCADVVNAGLDDGAAKDPLGEGKDAGVDEGKDAGVDGAVEGAVEAKDAAAEDKDAESEEDVAKGRDSDADAAKEEEEEKKAGDTQLHLHRDSSTGSEGAGLASPTVETGECEADASADLSDVSSDLFVHHDEDDASKPVDAVGAQQHPPARDLGARKASDDSRASATGAASPDPLVDALATKMRTMNTAMRGQPRSKPPVVAVIACPGAGCSDGRHPLPSPIA